MATGNGAGPCLVSRAHTATASRLEGHHRQHLQDELGAEGVDRAVEIGARSIDADEAHRLGFRWGSHRTGGLLLPFGGDFAQLRCDDPPIAANGDPVKYLNRKGARPQPATFGTGAPTVATEGWKDALAIHLATGATVQAIPGVTAHKAMAPSVVQLVYDADAQDNPAVWGQLVTAGLQRKQLRLAFFPADVAGPKGGACEFINGGGDYTRLKWFSARELLRELPTRWSSQMRPDWKVRAVRTLARLSIAAKIGKDASEQIVLDAARAVKLQMGQARAVLDAERRKVARPTKELSSDAPAYLRLIEAAGRPPKRKVNAGQWSAALAAGAGHRLRRNLLTQQTELDGSEISVESEELLFVWAQRAGWDVRKPDCYDGTRAVALGNSYHPVREYLDRVGNDPAIAAVDLDTVAARYLGVRDSLSAAMIRCALIGAVARIYQPGCVPPGAVVLRGDQGIGKSGFWQALGGDFYVVSRETDNPKDAAMAMHRSWIYDLDELDKVTTSRKAAALRSLITTQVDVFRVPFARKEQAFPRQFVIVGAVNGDGFLTDPEGNRRYWVIDCPQKKGTGRFIDGPGAARDRDAIWKAAVRAYNSGAAWTLSVAEQAASNARNGQWEAVDEWQAALADWAAKTLTPGGFTTREAIVGAGLRNEESIQRADEMRAAAELRRAGFHRSGNKATRADGRRDRFWSVASDHPAQPHDETGEEVGQAQNAGPDSDLSTTDQPNQPFLGIYENGDKGDRVHREEADMSLHIYGGSFLDGQVGQGCSDPLQRNGSGGNQPPPLPSRLVIGRYDTQSWVGAARDALADAGMEHGADACVVCLKAWHDAHPDRVPYGISKAQVQQAYKRLAPYRPVGATINTGAQP